MVVGAPRKNIARTQGYPQNPRVPLGMAPRLLGWATRRMLRARGRARGPCLLRALRATSARGVGDGRARGRRAQGRLREPCLARVLEATSAREREIDRGQRRRAQGRPREPCLADVLGATPARKLSDGRGRGRRAEGRPRVPCLGGAPKATSHREGSKRPRAAAAPPRTAKGALLGQRPYGHARPQIERRARTWATRRRMARARRQRLPAKEEYIRGQRRRAQARPRAAPPRGGKDAPTSPPCSASLGAPRPAGGAVRAARPRPSLAY